MLGINRYDEFGQPQSTNIGRFGYTGQAWMPELGLYYYRARMYEPELGRFMQTDPIGYADSPNLYQYVLNDPVNLTDPLGLEGSGIINRTPCGPALNGACSESIVIVGKALWELYPDATEIYSDIMPGLGIGPSYFGGGGNGSNQAPDPNRPIVVSAPRIKPLPKPPSKPASEPLVETPSLDAFTFWNHYRHGSGETICLTPDQFRRVSELGKRQGKTNPNGANLVSFYGTPLENTFGSATIFMRGGKAVGFRDTYDFNMGAGRSLQGELKTIGGAILGAGAEPFETRFPC